MQGGKLLLRRIRRRIAPLGRVRKARARPEHVAVCIARPGWRRVFWLDRIRVRCGDGLHGDDLFPRVPSTVIHLHCAPFGESAAPPGQANSAAGRRDYTIVDPRELFQRLQNRDVVRVMPTRVIRYGAYKFLTPFLARKR